MSVGEGSSSTIAERLERETQYLPPSGRRVARALLARYPAAGLDTVASLAHEANVSAPSVVRFITALGFDSFRDFQDVLRDELGGRDASALSQARAMPSRPGDPLAATKGALVTGIEESLPSQMDGDFFTAVTLLADSTRRVATIGGDYSSGAAAHLVAQLAPLRANVQLVNSSSLLAAAAVADIQKNDVWVLFDLRRYSPRIFDLANFARERGATILLVTDRWRSPIDRICDVALVVRVESAGASDTLVPALALVEALSEAVERRRGGAALERLTIVDRVRRGLDGLPGADEDTVR